MYMHIVVADNFSSVSMVVLYIFHIHIYRTHWRKKNQIFIQFIQCTYAYIHVLDEIKNTK